MRFKIWALSVATTFGLLAASPAFATSVLEVAPVGLMNLANARLNQNGTSTSTSSNAGFGFGALVYFPLMPFLSLESGILYVPNKFTVNSTTQYSLTYAQIPVVARFSPLPFLSVGAGGYFAFSLGNVSTTNTSTSVTTDSTYTAANLNTGDIGLLASAALELPVAPFTSLLVDARYLLGLKDLSALSGSSLKLGGIMVLAGLKFGL